VAAAGALCRAAAIPFHVDAVQVVGHLPLAFSGLPVDLLTCTAHKLQGPRGIGLLLRRRGHALQALVGGSQEGGLRGGTEPVALAAGFAQALRDATARLARHGQRDPLTDLRDRLLERLVALPGVRLSGPDPRDPAGRLPHHLSLLVADRRGVPLAGRELVRDLWRQGLAVSSGSACRSAAGAAAGSPVLRAMGYGEPAELATRLVTLPEVPTLNEQGIFNVEVPSWYTLMAPAKTPRAAAERLRAEVRRVVAIAEFRDTLAKQAIDVQVMPQSEFTAFLKADSEKYVTVVKKAGITLQ
jgi:cysteine desulfurase